MDDNKVMFVVVSQVKKLVKTMGKQCSKEFIMRLNEMVAKLIGEEVAKAGKRVI